MISIHRRPDWSIAEAQATPEAVFLNRRALLKDFGFGALSAAAICALPGNGRSAESDPTADLYPTTRNTRYKLERGITPEEINSRYNNFYEFGSHKEISQEAQRLVIRPWDISIDGLVEKPFTIAFDDLVRRIPLEERLYRHRCVEAWSMTVPWSGFPLAALVDLARPLSGAKYIRFETFNDPDMASGQKQVWYPWPYVEGVTLAEARNDLAFLVTGAYGKPLAKQFGAPIRLALPWKYGFKSIKSIRKITFTDERPTSFWEQIAPKEYGFWANVNPGVPHARWSQKQERVLETGLYVQTRMFNGYREQVADLYKEIRDEHLYT